MHLKNKFIVHMYVCAYIIYVIYKLKKNNFRNLKIKKNFIF